MMKTIKAIYATLIVVVATFMGAGCTSSKGTTTTTQDSLANLMAKRLFEDQQFVLTANRISIGNSPTIVVNDATNFILVNGDQGTIQISPRMGGGPNGVGGITASGTVSGYNISYGKKGDAMVSFRVIAPVGSADVRISLKNTSNGATAFVSATFNRARCTLNGDVNPLPRSMITGVGPALRFIH